MATSVIFHPKGPFSPATQRQKKGGENDEEGKKGGTGTVAVNRGNG